VPTYCTAVPSFAILGYLHSTFLTSSSDELCWCPGVGKILGYVATGYGANNFTFNYPGGSTNRTLPVVLSYIDMYYTTYKCNTSVRLDGIFLDEAATWVSQQTPSAEHNRTDSAWSKESLLGLPWSKQMLGITVISSCMSFVYRVLLLVILPGVRVSLADIHFDVHRQRETEVKKERTVRGEKRQACEDVIESSLNKFSRRLLTTASYFLYSTTWAMAKQQHRRSNWHTTQRL
jgi:uncharacterized membrane protein